ncbi:MAG: DNA polymerase I [Eggerthellaceae bacterium]|nr:DNA polymerase I [Eggerthellaceae bacterium]
MESSKKVAVIDGNSLMHRAYHGVPPTMNAADGTPTNAVFGFLQMILKFIDMEKPDAIVCAFDAGKPSFRIEQLEQYKAQRPPMDDELRVQFPIMEELLTSMGIPVVKVPGWEGDDILGTVAARDEALGYRTLLITGDKDAYQLATDATSIVTTKKGLTDVQVYGPAEVEERYGVTPAQFIDFLGLMGDSSDNIPGVAGIGPKNAAKLLAQFGSIEGVYEHVDELKGKQKENIIAGRESAFLSRKIATIVTDLDFPLDLEGLSFPSFEPESVQEAFGKYSLSSQMSRVLALVGASPAQVPAAEINFGELVGEEDAARALVGAAIEEGRLIGIARIAAADRAGEAQASLFADEPQDLLAFACGEKTAVLEPPFALELLADVVARGTFAALDLKELLHCVLPADSSIEALVTEQQLMANRGFDVSLAAYALNSSSRSYALESLCEDCGLGALPAFETEEEQVACAAEALRQLVPLYEERLKEDGSADPYFEIDLPLVAVLAAMERVGVEIDTAGLADLAAFAEGQLDALSAEIYEQAGEVFNIDSPKQLGRILFEVMGLPAQKKNQRGYSTDASVLKELAKVSEVPALVLRYREMAKLKSTYLDALPKLAQRAGDGRIHTMFHETVTTTGRLSSSDPNLQNIPVRTDFGRRIRECFVPLDEDSLFLSADYSQIELRLLAHLSADEHLVAAFNSGADFHTATAARVFDIAPEDVTPAQRSRAKAVNFGIVYGQQAFGLSQTLDIPVAEAKEMIDRYFAAYPGVRRYLDETVADAKQLGYAETMFGRKRHIPELKAKNYQQRSFGERTAMNHPMQGSAADVIKLAMRRVQQRLMEEGMAAKLLIQVHDELDFSVPRDEVEQLAALVKEIMENVVELRVPLTADVSWGENWAEAH